MTLTKGGLISESFSPCLKSQKNFERYQLSLMSTFSCAQDCDLAPFFVDLSQSEKPYKIKPPLVGSKNK